MPTKKPEDGIRSYLDSLGKSNKPVVHREAVKALQDQLRSEPDPIQKLKLLTALDEEREGHAPDLEGEKAVFIAEAKAWADAEGISVAAFQALKVPDEVLVQAGFDVAAARRKVIARASSGGSSNGRAPRIPLEDVKVAASKLGLTWKLTDLATALDRDAPTVRNYVNKLVSDGAVTIVGEDPGHDGRGRAPKVYTLA
jgi:hypothetical protein